MAEQLDQFPERIRSTKYPWDEWLNGKPWLLRQGEDYTVSTASMRALASKMAKTRGKRVRAQAGSVSDGSETLVIQAIEAAVDR